VPRRPAHGSPAGTYELAHDLQTHARLARAVAHPQSNRVVATGTRRAPRTVVHDLTLPLPPLALVHCAVAAVWLYEGLWCKLLGREARQVDVVEAVPKLGPLVGRGFLKVLGLVEVGLAIWVISGLTPGLCAVAQTALLVALNANGLLWARHIIHDPGGMVVKNASFLLLAWLGAAMNGASQ
jgi:hypothetical protein